MFNRKKILAAIAGTALLSATAVIGLQLNSPAEAKNPPQLKVSTNKVECAGWTLSVQDLHYFINPKYNLRDAEVDLVLSNNEGASKPFLPTGKISYVAASGKVYQIGCFDRTFDQFYKHDFKSMKEWAEHNGRVHQPGVYKVGFGEFIDPGDLITHLRFTDGDRQVDIPLNFPERLVYPDPNAR